MKKVLISLGTRPEIIKFYPIIEALKKYNHIKVFIVNTGQQRQLSDSFTKQFDIKIDKDYKIMKPNQSLNYVASEIINRLDTQLEIEKPDLVLVQGDTTTATASALAAFYRKIPVGHVEAGLRTNQEFPFPEEANRRLITQLASYHFCPTKYNLSNVEWELAEKKNYKAWVTGNTAIDVVKSIKPKVVKKDYKQILVTLHRRENVESGLAYNYLDILDGFIWDWHQENLDEIRIKWVTHPNSDLKQRLEKTHKLDYFDIVSPMPYDEFINECYNSDLILSDSGGCQEEASIIKTPLWVLRKQTERPEIFQLSFTKLVKDPLKLKHMLYNFFSTIPKKVKPFKNPFGTGKSGGKIAKLIATKILK